MVELTSTRARLWQPAAGPLGFPGAPHWQRSLRVSPAAASRLCSRQHAPLGRHVGGRRPAVSRGAGGGGAAAQHAARHRGQPVVWQPGRVSGARRGGRQRRAGARRRCCAPHAPAACRAWYCLDRHAATVPLSPLRPASLCRRLRSERPYATATALSKEALAEVIDKLLQVSGTHRQPCGLARPGAATCSLLCGWPVWRAAGPRSSPSAPA